MVFPPIEFALLSTERGENPLSDSCLGPVVPQAGQTIGNGGRQHMDQYGCDAEQSGKGRAYRATLGVAGSFWTARSVALAGFSLDSAIILLCSSPPRLP